VVYNQAVPKARPAATATARSAGGKRERTRAALAAAALELIREKGFAEASLDDIAARAGMTKGAIYSNFRNKAELLVAAMAASGLTLSAAGAANAGTVTEEITATAAALTGLLARAESDHSLLIAFQVHALADPDLRQALAEVYSAGFTGTAEHLAGLGGGGTMPPRELAVALQAMAMGFLAQSLLSPGEVTPGIVERAFAAFARGLSLSSAP